LRDLFQRRRSVDDRLRAPLIRQEAEHDRARFSFELDVERRGYTRKAAVPTPPALDPGFLQLFEHREQRGRRTSTSVHTQNIAENRRDRQVLRKCLESKQFLWRGCYKNCFDSRHFLKT